MLREFVPEVPDVTFRLFAKLLYKTHVSNHLIFIVKLSRAQFNQSPNAVLDLKRLFVELIKCDSSVHCYSQGIRGFNQ